MHGLANINLPIAITGKIGWAENRQNEAYRAVLFPFTSIRPAGGVPALYDLLQKATCEKALSVGAREALSLDGGSAVGVLMPVEDFQGLGEFSRG